MRSRSLLWSFNYAIDGIVYALRTQRNMRLHVAAAILVLVSSLFFRITALEFVIVAFAIALVFATELLNTAVEAVVDMAVDGFDPLAKIAKDVAAGGVFIASVNAVIVGYVIFYSHVSGASTVILTRVKETPEHVTVLSLALVALVTLVTKAFTPGGTFMRGGWPSGHTALASGAAVAIGFTTGSAGATLLALLVAALVGQSRVESDAHTVPQVALGGLLGALITTIVFQLLWF